MFIGLTPGPSGDPATLLYSSGYYAVEPVLIYNTDSFKPASWADLEGASVALLDGTRSRSYFAKVRADHPEVKWESLRLHRHRP